MILLAELGEEQWMDTFCEPEVAVSVYQDFRLGHQLSSGVYTLGVDSA